MSRVCLSRICHSTFYSSNNCCFISATLCLRLDNAGNHGVHVYSLEEHEGEAHREEVVDADGYDAAFNGHRLVV